MPERSITPAAREAEPAAQPIEESAAAAPKAAAGGFKAWLPLLVTAALMPGLAYATTQFVLLPKIKKAMAQTASASPDAPEPAAAGKDGAAGAKGGKLKVTVQMPKILVNVAGTMMTRYLMTSMTLVGNTPDFKDKIADNKDQLIDVANGALSTKTIADLEKPGSRNVIRAELKDVFNNALGAPLVQDIYITEQAIQ